MGKHRGANTKHRSAGVLGKPVSLSLGETTSEETRLGLERGSPFLFAPAVTAKATPINGDTKESEAIFSRATFRWSDGVNFFFLGEPVDKKNRHHRLMNFSLQEKDLRAQRKVQVGASLGEGVEE